MRAKTTRPRPVRPALVAAALGLVALAAPGLLPAPALAQSPPVAIVGGTVWTGADREPIAGATVVLSGGRVQAVGRDVRPPAGARIVDAAGKVVTPGFLDSSTRLGLVEVGAVAGTRDFTTDDDRVTAAFRVVDGINPFSSAIPVTRVEGVTRAVVAPATGASLIAGQGALVDLATGPVPDVGEMVHRDPVAMFAVLGEAGARLAGGARGAALLRLREALAEARDFAAYRPNWDRGARRPYELSRLDLEALAPVVDGRLPLAVHADRASDLLAVLRLRDEFTELDLVILGAAEGWIVADRLAAAGVPVVIDPMTNIPDFEDLGSTLENAARLHAAGVTVAFATFDAHNSRNLRQAAGNAVAYGMPWRAALEAITVTPARIWGIERTYGTLERGKDGDVVVWSGDPFEPLTQVEHVFVEGREISLETRQTELYERYRQLEENRPPAYRRP